ncbi:MAG: Rdx family protein [Candidatus Dormibacteraeota bacterium]|uniref:Rdx family protein n=1 Tax=Candidatus Dormiibacter inghamiae TaxID=3127013 RepID=A0A934KEU2_9BACT|nr:Rdx family protein [Candidatus Dormibacteraeota bacterium]MBJ7605449.1 Rdx family protein [Candidatus Dormibacteraeota bacterium]
MDEAAGLAAEILGGWAPILTGLEMKPGKSGRFEVSVDGELVFSKAALKRHARPGEIAGLLSPKLGPPLDWR